MRVVVTSTCIGESSDMWRPTTTWSVLAVGGGLKRARRRKRGGQGVLWGEGRVLLVKLFRIFN
jgi:hypothetical protein